jgi:hypothetical protein
LALPGTTRLSAEPFPRFAVLFLRRFVTPPADVEVAPGSFLSLFLERVESIDPLLESSDVKDAKGAAGLNANFVAAWSHRWHGLEIRGILPALHCLQFKPGFASSLTWEFSDICPRCSNPDDRLLAHVVYAILGI